MATSKIKSKSERMALIQEFQVSGMTKTAWCKEKGIACATFYNGSSLMNRNNKW